mgnify:CR=1 FL=1
MKKLLILLFFFTAFAYSGDNIFDSVGYRYYHDLDNEHDGSKFRAYVTKKFYKSKFKFAYERKRTGMGTESGTWFIDHEHKF